MATEQAGRPEAVTLDQRRWIDAIAAGDRLPASTEEDRERVRTALLAAYRERDRAWRREEIVINTIVGFGMALWVMIVLLAQWRMDAMWHGATFTWRTLLGPLTVFFAAGTLSMIPMYLVADRRHAREPETRAPINDMWTMRPIPRTVLMLAMTAGFAVWGTRVLPGGPVSLLWTLGVELAVAALLFAVLLLPATALAGGLDTSDPRQTLVADLAAAFTIATDTWAVPGDDDADPVAVTWIDRRTAEWRTTRKARRVFAKLLESSARHVEAHFAGLAPRAMREVRADLGDIGAGIATSLRHHARNILIGGADRDDVLAGELGTALIAASGGRWEDLAVDPPAARAQRLLRRFGPKLLGAALLAAAAIVLPAAFADWLGATGPQLRIALFVAAALTLIDTPAAAFNKLADIVKAR